MRNVTISNVTATTSSKTASNITGIPGAMAENISLSNIIITSLGDGTEEEAKIEVREKDKNYPTARIFGNTLPASGFFIRHVRNITMDNVQLFVKGENVRPAIILHEIHDAPIRYAVVYSYKTKVG